MADGGIAQALRQAERMKEDGERDADDEQRHDGGQQAGGEKGAPEASS